MTKIYTIVVTYNGMRWYDKCFNSLRASSLPVTPIVIDNASTDGSVEYIRNNYPEVHIIPNNDNLGFAKANNLGFKYALENNVDYVFLLNQDAWVEKNTIAELVNTFKDNENVGIASPVHLNGSYTGLDFNFPYYMNLQFVSDLYLKQMQHYYVTEFVNAAAWMISMDCIRRVGGFDTSLFQHYGEDDNFAQRVKYHGYKLIINAQCTICHDRGNRANSFDTTKFNPNQTERFEKLEKGNVLLHFDADVIIKAKQKELRKAYLGIHPRKVARLRKEIALIELIKKSRERNMRGGLVWLD